MEFSKISESTTDPLICEIKKGDMAAFEKLFAIYFPRLNNYAKSIIKESSTSEDIVQEAFITLWNKRNELEIPKPEAFLYRIVRNRCIDYIRHVRVVQNKMISIDESQPVDELYSFDLTGNEPVLLIAQELNDQIESVFNQLPEKCREVFTLSRIDGLKNREIAERLNISIKNVERHISRAMKSFKESFPDNIPFQIILLAISLLRQ